ncbi:MAG: RNA polymerase sigma factor [Thermoanaerobaculia bacterium]
MREPAPAKPVFDYSDLIRRCRLGDDLAWESLVRRLEGRVFAITLHYMRDREEARDTAQDIFIRLYEKLHTVREDKPFLAWVMRLSRNCCIDRLRRLNVRTPAHSVALENAPDLKVALPTPEEACLESARDRLVYRALGTLSERNREIIVLKDIQEMKLIEIAEMMSAPLGTIKSRWNRARVELAKAIRSLEPSEEAIL